MCPTQRLNHHVERLDKTLFLKNVTTRCGSWPFRGHSRTCEASSQAMCSEDWSKEPMAQQLGPAIERATSPPRGPTFDGIGAFDVVSRRAMLEGLQTVEGGDSAMPFVLQFFGSASSDLWEDQEGVVHTIVQAEGGEQGDPLMLALCLSWFNQSQAARWTSFRDSGMCTLCAHLPVSMQFLRFCSASSSPTLPFEFITGRFKCCST